MPKGVDHLFSSSAASTATLLPSTPRKTVDPNSGDTARGQTFRKALDQAKPKPKAQDSAPTKPRTTPSRLKTTSKKNSDVDTSDTPTDQNVSPQPTKSDPASDGSNTEATGPETNSTQGAQPTSDKPAKPGAADETAAANDAENQANAVVLASTAANDAQPTPQPQTDDHLDQAQDTAAPQRVQTSIDHVSGPTRKVAPRGPRIAIVKPISPGPVKKVAPEDNAPKSSDNSDAEDDIAQNLTEQTEQAPDPATTNTLPQETPVTKTAKAPHDTESQTPALEAAPRTKPAQRPVAKANSDSSNDTTAQAANLNVDADLPSPVTSDDRSSPADRLSPLEALSVLDTTTPAAKATTTIPVQANQPPAPPPAPDQDFGSTNHDRIVTSMRSQLLPNGGTMHLRLDPPELGVLQVSVRMVDGAMTASFETSNDQATKLLSHSLGQLKQVLETSGVSVEKLHVQQTPSNQQSSSNNEDRQQSPDKENQSARQEQQRREMLQRMWRKLRLGSAWRIFRAMRRATCCTRRLPGRIFQQSRFHLPMGSDMTTTPVQSTPSPNKLASNFALNTDDFIKMMVTQLQNQDPLNPTQNQDLLAQMSQIGQLQSTTQLQTTIQSMALQSNLGAAGNMIGKTVQGLDANGNPIGGVVNSVQVQSGNVFLQLDSGQSMALAQITSISQPTSTAAAAPAKS
jgi:flagellar basal-body rod modification protein FlgD